MTRENSKRALFPVLALLLLAACSDDRESAPTGDAPAATPAAAPAETATETAAAAVREIVDPPEADRPAWLETRRAAQLAAADQIGVFHDFAFSDRLEQSGITFRHRSTADSGKKWIAVHYDHGNSVSIADVDGDGLEDVFFVSQLGSNGLWRNLGNGKFEELPVRGTAGLADRVSVAGSFADIDNDGDPDLYVTTVRGGNALFENDGKGAFTDISKDSGLDYVGHSSASVFFDYNNDGLLDVFLTNVGSYTKDVKTPDGNYVGLDDAFSGHLKPERFEQSRLYENKGGNRFEDVSEKRGIQDLSWTGAALPVDFNEDGWVDLYVLNMQGLDQYYVNMAGKGFENRSESAFPRTSWGAMGAQTFDYDNDGDQDLFISDMHSDMSRNVGPELEEAKSDITWAPDFLVDGGNGIYGNSFFRNDGSGKFVEISDSVGAENYWPWGLSSGDLNADGWQDVFVASSMNYPWRYAANSLLLNDAGQRFADAEFILGVEPRRGGETVTDWFELDCAGDDLYHRNCPKGGGAGRITVKGALGSRSSVLFDLDGDGDLDIVTNDFHSAPMVLISDLSERKQIHHLTVALEGTKSNRNALGARVEVRAGKDRFTRINDGQSGYLGQSVMPLYFGLGDHATVDEIRVRWPSGDEQVVKGPVEANQRIEVVEGK